MSNEVWLVRWEHSGDHAKPERPIALVLPGEYSTELVRQITHAVYNFKTSTPGEMLSYATGGLDPYPAEIHPLQRGGDSIICGHNPFLMAERVRNAKENTNGKLVWDDMKKERE